MQRRYLIVGLAFILAIAIAVPALGVDAGPSASVKKVTKKVKKLSQRVAALEDAGQTPGPQGEQGAPGEQGDPGPTGPSNASSDSDGSIAIPDVKAAIQDVPTPAGSYVFWGKVDMSGAGDVECDLRTSAPASVQDRATVDNPAGDGNTLALLGTATTTGGDVNLDCADGAGGAVTANNVRLVAQRVGALTEE